MESIYFDEILWIVFVVIVSITLTIDLFSEKFSKKLRLLHKNHNAAQQQYPLNLAILWTVVWLSFGVMFAGIIYSMLGSEKALEYITGYALEKSLSVDNMLIFVLIFTSLGIAHVNQHKVLMWGILGAIGMRIGFILAGVTLLETFHWMVYVLGAILIFTSIRMIVKNDKEKLNLEKSLAIRVIKKFANVDPKPTNSSFFVKTNGIRYVTPLFVALVSIEVTDVIFAMDSLPAVLAITRDPFIVITSNVFAILGLRSLYFLVGGGIQKLVYLKYGLTILLGFIGIKMLVSEIIEIPLMISLAVVFSILGVTIAASLIRSKSKR